MKENTEKKTDIARREEEILKFWKDNNIFEKTSYKPAPKGEFVFYDGPPFATGLPHYGHILAGTIKDAIPRYKTMQGFRVRRKWGWDCHGLPLENEIEEELGLESKKDIEELGVGKFNEAAQNAVLRYSDDWKKIVPRMGRWVDMERDYKTMDISYMESVWWVFKTIYEKGLIYEGFKSMHLCPRCGTTISNFEVAQGYKDITDFSVTVKFELVDELGTYLLVWTTTPWTLPGNMAVVINKDAVYVAVEQNKERFIVAKERLSLFEGEYKVIRELSGAELVGKEYIPPFSYYKDKNIKNKKNAWKIYHAPYVSLEEGTGAVHLAPAFGAEDLELAEREGVPIVHHVKEDGTFRDEVTDFKGMSVKPKDTNEEKDKHQSTDIEIIKHLAHKNLLFKKEKIVHSYPHCWRCDTPLLNYASSSWFLKVTDIKKQLVSENEKIDWVPQEIGEKRFGNWLKGARDWAISRSRYWGAPLPVWKNKKTGKIHTIGSVEELKALTKKSGNSYFIMRHGEAEYNTKNILNSKQDIPNALTPKGKSEIIKSARKFGKDPFDFVIHSPIQRARETAYILAEELNISEGSIKSDDRLREISFGQFEGESVEGYHSFFAFTHERFTKSPEGGETWAGVKKRVTELMYELEREHKNKKILIVSHNGPLQMLQAGVEGSSVDQCAEYIASNSFDLFTGEIKKIDFTPLPHNERYELDLHRPYIDEIELVDKDGEVLKRVPDVFDCWFESGSMPYGQQHYPFDNRDIFEPRSSIFKKAKGYPADFIAEGLDQTRGWFYSLLVLGVALFKRAPYKHVIVNGLVLGESGTKLSKRLKNYSDPMEIASLYGADSLRYYLLSSPIVRGEDLVFTDKGVGDVMRKLIGRLQNVYAFYTLYRSPADGYVHLPERPTGSHPLDRWILTRLDQLTRLVTEGMENYELDKATRPISDFIEDLSTWYLRRSRDRFKGEDREDKNQSLVTTRFVLRELSKLMAPFMPFYAESLYREVRANDGDTSVHLTSWPTVVKVDQSLLKDMSNVRSIISLALEARASAEIKVRQPLRKLTIKRSISPELLFLIKDEVNVKEIDFDETLDEQVKLDTNIDDALKEEGLFRDITRHIQDLRKQNNLTPDDTISLSIETDDKGKKLIEKYKKDIQNIALINEIIFEDVGGEGTVFDPYLFKIAIK